MYNGSEEVFLYLRSPSTQKYHRLSGIQNASFSHSTNESSTRLLLSDEQKTGRLMQRTNRRFSSPQSVSCSFDKCYINQDFIKTFTGLNNISGVFLYGDSYLAFDDAVINQYSVTLTPSQTPKISVGMDIYGNLQPTGASSFKAHEEKQDFYELQKVNPTGVVLNYGNKLSPVQSFSYSASFSHTPTYEIDSIKSSTVRLKDPIIVNTSARLELLEREFDSITGVVKGQDTLRFETFASGGHIEGTGRDLASTAFEFSIKGETGNILDTFPIGNNVILQSQDLSITTNDTISLSLQHKGELFLNIDQHN